MKKTLILVLLGMCAATSMAQTANSAVVANRRTAIQYLHRAKQYASEKQWTQAHAQAELGLAYDAQIADLWYVSAVSQSMLGATYANVLPLVEKSLTDADWVDYNRDNARILYADILANTGRFEQAVAVLDDAPFLYSADAEYIRAKSFYNFHTEAYTQRAREKLHAASRIYPMDVRFARLFFVHEYALEKDALYGNGVLPPLVRKLADAFILQLPQYADADAELELYAAIFATGSRRTRLLTSFKARGLKAPLYAETALRAALISQSEAVERFVEFADVAVDRAVLESFVTLITEPEARRYLAEYLTAYNGSVVSDTDGDLQPNLTVLYVRGRPSFIAYDADQDGVADWTAECDFGVPLLVQLADGGAVMQYASWPWLHKVRYPSPASAGAADTADATNADAVALEFTLLGETLAWSPFSVAALPSVTKALDVAFFYPALFTDTPAVSIDDLLRSSSSYELASQERVGAKIRVSLLDGVPQQARYYTAQGVLYAQAQFDGGVPVVRMVDTNGDGLFETAEHYGRAEAGDAVTAAGEMQALAALSAVTADANATPTGAIYIQMIQIDQNGDTVPDFIEEYQADGGKVASWDADGDGLWDTRYVRRARTDGEPLHEESLFHQPLTSAVVSVVTEDGKPTLVREGEREIAIVEADGMYWLGEKGSDAAAKELIGAVSQIGMQGVSIIVEHKDGGDGERMLAVRVGNMIFGELLPPSAANDDEQATKE